MATKNACCEQINQLTPFGRTSRTYSILGQVVAGYLSPPGAWAARARAPERVAGTCGISAEAIRRIARELSDAPRAAVYGRIGTCNQEFGTLASWLVDVLNVLTGNLDREGGAMFANPIAWSLAALTPPEFANGFVVHRWRSRVRGAPEVLGQVPLSCLAEEIATPGPGQVHALVTIAGNAALSAPDAGKLDAALPALDFMVSVDNWLNETTRHADVILPGLSHLEQPHYDELIWSWAVRNAGKYSPPLFDPGARPHEGSNCNANCPLPARSHRWL